MTPKVSVIIPNYNYGRFLSDAVVSALGQSVRPHEIIVVDDGSTDDSLEMLSRFGDDVTVIRQKNGGVGAARNAGVRASSGDFIAFLDADDYWLGEKLSKQLAMFESDPDLGLVTTGMREVSLGGEQIALHLRGMSGWCSEDLLLFRPVVSGPGSTSLVRRELFESVGGFDERKELHPSEDWEFSFRIAQVSKIGFIEEVLAVYRNHGGNGHLNIKRLERSMTMALESAIERLEDRSPDRIRRSYGRLYRTLAGSYFHAGDRKAFLRMSLRCIATDPSSLIYFAGMPVRVLKRKVVR